jgi:hypothetical protein
LYEIQKQNDSNISKHEKELLSLTSRIVELTKAQEALERSILNLEREAHNTKMDRLELNT